MNFGEEPIRQMTVPQPKKCCEAPWPFEFKNHLRDPKKACRVGKAHACRFFLALKEDPRMFWKMFISI